MRPVSLAFGSVIGKLFNPVLQATVGGLGGLILGVFYGDTYLQIASNLNWNVSLWQTTAALAVIGGYLDKEKSSDMKAYMEMTNGK